MGEVEDEKTATVAQFKAQLEGIEKAVTKSRKVLSAGYGYRWVDCKVLYHTPLSRRRTIVRLDTGEEVRIEDMSEDECQDKLPRGETGNLANLASSESAAAPPLTLEPDPPADPIIDPPIAAAAKEAVEHGSNGKRKRVKEKSDPQTQVAGYPV